MRAYITGSSAISPQPTFEQDAYLKEMVTPAQDYLTAVEPDYKAHIDPKLSRRMARIIKMGITTAKSCLGQSEVAQPEAIIVGTGLGCLQDTEKFLADLIENREGLLSPTAFIQSTHNTIAGQIALVLGCPYHNFTFVQRGHSFENALQDGLLQLEEGANDVLVGGVDEATPTVFDILRKTACADKPLNRYPIMKATDQKPAWGEGASFFMLSSKPSEKALACIESTHTFYRPDTHTDITNQINLFLNKANTGLHDIDAVMMGYNGYQKDDLIYQALHQSLFKGKTILSFKNLCGEYFTASSFGHHLAANVLHKQEIFKNTLVAGDPHTPLGKILFYNHYKGQYHTLTLLSGCRPL